MAQSSLVPKKPHFSDPAKAKAAGAHANRRAGPGPEFRHLRLQQVIEMKTRGLSTAEIAKYFNCSEDTIERDVTKIKRDGLVEKYERKFLGKLMPLAFAKIERVLKADDTDLEGVKEIFKRFDKLSEQKHQKELIEGGQKEDTLSGWYDAWVAQQAPQAPPADAIEAEFEGGEDAGNHKTEGEASIAAGSIGGSATVGGPGAQAAAPSASPDASQSGLEAAPESGIGPSGDDSTDTGA